MKSHKPPLPAPRVRSRVPLCPLVLLVALLCAAAPALAGGAAPDTVRLATGSVGGTFLPVGHDLAEWWEQTVPGVVVVVDTTAGSVDNLERLIRGTADVAIVGASPFQEILEGWGTKTDEAQELCTVGTLYDDAEQFVIRASLVRAGNLLDLNGLHMYPGPHNSGGEIDTRLVLNTLEVEPRYVYVDERDKGYTAAAAALVRGDFDAATFSGGVPIQAITDLMEVYPGEYRILPFTRHMLRKLMYYENGFLGVVVKAGSYPGQTEDIRTVGGPNLLVAAPHLDRTILADLDQAVREGIEVPAAGLRTEDSHPVLRVLDLDRWVSCPAGLRCPALITADLKSSLPEDGF